MDIDLNGVNDYPEHGADWVERMKDVPMCGRCYDFVDKTYTANCFEKPELLKEQAMGQYHCPDCGAMLLAGIPHPPLCGRCIDRKHPGFDE